MELVERRLRVKEVHLTRAAHHEEKNASLGSRREMRSRRSGGRVSRSGGRRCILGEQVGECHCAETVSCHLEKTATGPPCIRVLDRCQWTWATSGRDWAWGVR